MSHQQNTKPSFAKTTYSALYPYGSRIYGTAQANSDWDYVAIDENSSTGEMIRGKTNIRLMTPQHFQSLLDKHHVIALECLFLPLEKIEIKPTKPWNFRLDRAKLQSSLLEKVNKDWVNAKKKFTTSYEYGQSELYKGKKSLFHSFRILSYGIQIVKFGKIVAYDEMNYVYEKLMSNSSCQWKDYEEEWKPFFTVMSSDFQKILLK